MKFHFEAFICMHHFLDKSAEKFKKGLLTLRHHWIIRKNREKEKFSEEKVHKLNFKEFYLNLTFSETGKS